MTIGEVPSVIRSPLTPNLELQHKNQAISTRLTPVGWWAKSKKPPYGQDGSFGRCKALFSYNGSGWRR